MFCFALLVLGGGGEPRALYTLGKYTFCPRAFETRSQLCSPASFCPSLLSVGITDIQHQAWLPQVYFLSRRWFSILHSVHLITAAPGWPKTFISALTDSTRHIQKKEKSRVESISPKYIAFWPLGFVKKMRRLRAQEPHWVTVAWILIWIPSLKQQTGPWRPKTQHPPFA